MKRLRLMTACLIGMLVPMAGLYALPVNKVVIKGILVNVKLRASKLYFFIDHKLADSAMVKNDSYQFVCQINGTSHLVIKETKTPGLDGHKEIVLLVKQGMINIRSEHSISNVVLSGNGAQAALDFRKAIKNTLLVTDKLNEAILSDAYKTDDLLRTDVKIKASFMAEEMIEQLNKYLLLHPDSPAAAYMAAVVYEHTYPSTEEISKLIKKIPAGQQVWLRQRIGEIARQKDAIAQTKQNAIKIEKVRKENLENQTAVGKVAMEFSQADTAGNLVSLSSYKGKYVLIDFWASWCQPCRAENPTVKKAYNAYKDKGFSVLGISIDGRGFGSRASWIKAIKADGLEWTQILDLKDGENEIAKLYNVTAIPRNFLIDPAGVIIAKDLRGEALEQQLAKIFKP